MTTTAISFDGSTLFTSPRSPFGRRVRLALIEAGVTYQEKIVDVFKLTDEFLAVNPLGRVPALALSDGKVLVDSNLILMALYAGCETSLIPADRDERCTCYEWSALASGLCEKTVEYYFEKLKPAEKQDAEFFAEYQAILDRILPRFDALIAEREWIAGGSITQADLDMGSALAYLSLRFNKDWMTIYPAASAYLARLEDRPSFQKTKPPAA